MRGNHVELNFSRLYDVHVNSACAIVIVIKVSLKLFMMVLLAFFFIRFQFWKLIVSAIFFFKSGVFGVSLAVGLSNLALS